MLGRADTQSVVLPTVCAVFGRRTVDYVLDGGGTPAPQHEEHSPSARAAASADPQPVSSAAPASSNVSATQPKAAPVAAPTPSAPEPAAPKQAAPVPAPKPAAAKPAPAAPKPQPKKAARPKPAEPTPSRDEMTFAQRMVTSKEPTGENEIPGMAPAQKIIIVLALIAFVIFMGYTILTSMGLL